MKKGSLILCFIFLLSACSNKENPEPVIEKSTEVVKPVIEEEEEEEEVINDTTTLTGLEHKRTNNQHFAVMIENSPEARPQTGLTQADIVYEIKTEGNISRYLAFFHDAIPDVIGPVRSSRHYFIPLAEEMNFPYIHFGASTYAYDYLNSSDMKVPHIDGIKTGDLFFRDNQRIAPHNAYLKTDKLDDFSDLLITNEHFTFGDNSNTKGKDAISFSFKYNDFTHIKYEYNESDKLYYRFQENIPHVDRNTNEQIKVKNIIIQYAVHENINDDKYGRIDVSLKGAGNILYFSEGKQVTGSWKKGIGKNSIIYYDEDGQVLKVNRGNTWIQVVDKNTQISE